VKELSSVECNSGVFIAYCVKIKMPRFNVEKLWFPCTIVAVQILFLILFGTLVEYDDYSSPLTDSVNTHPESDGEIQQFYPR